MKTAEQAMEYAHARFPNDDLKIYIAASSYGDTVERMQSIWKKPSERPEMGSRIIVCGDCSTETHNVDDATMEDWNDRRWMPVDFWCYWSDFLSLLPDWAKEEPNATDEAVKAGADLSRVKQTPQAQMDVITGKPFQEEQK